MKIRPALAAAGAAALLASAWTGTAAAAPSPTGQTARSEHVCAKPNPGFASCHAIIRTDITGNGNRSNGKPGGGGGGTPVPPTSGYTPSDIQSAYNLGSSNGAGRTVAIVDAYDDPNAETDLSYYRTALKLTACTTANGCFRKVDQNGGTTYPRANGGWAQEISLDVDMVSAACPTCKILLVEANSASFADLGTAVDTAARLGAVAISNSYGGSDSAASSAYDHPGIAITASTGDNGYGVESPASFGTVVAVGGTSLKRASTSRGWSESAWSGAGSGCSTLNAKPSWQTSATQCSGKANADVSAVADPNTGVAVYDSYAYQGRSGWLVFGGTSASSPIVASVYALSGRTSGYPASYTWSNSAGLNDVTSGSNGSCSTSVWCNAGAGWDGPTGLGTPNGTTAF